MPGIHIIQQEPRTTRSLPHDNGAAIAKWSWTNGQWNVEDLVHLNIPSNCFIFTSSSSYLDSEHLRQALYRRFRIPDWFWSERHQRSNGSFGSGDVFHSGIEARISQIWSRYLVKQLKQTTHLNHHTYVWYEMGFFALQTAAGQVVILCFDTPEHFRQRLFQALNSSTWTLSEPVIYQLHAYLIDQIINLYDESVWALRDIVRDVEKHRSQVYGVEANFPSLHDIARHTIHVSETLDVAIENMSSMIELYLSAPETRLSCGTREKSTHAQTLQYFRFQLQTFKSLKARSYSNQARMQNEITLAFNLVHQRDSQMAIRISEAVRIDSTAMKTVAILTLTFLPATFVSAIFSTSFFNFSPSAELGSASWTISDHFWVYWAFSAPLTIATIGTWYAWQRWYVSQ